MVPLSDMGTPAMTRTRSILERNTRLPDDTLVVFDHPAEADPADGDRVRTVALNRSDWVELGSPDEITVTIEPGDQLNTGG